MSTETPDPPRKASQRTTREEIIASLERASPEGVRQWQAENAANAAKAADAAKVVVQPPISKNPSDETFSEKLYRKSMKDPFVPIGAVLTLGILMSGLYSFRTGNKRRSQLMMRYRVLAQGATVVAMVVGVLGVNFKNALTG